MSTAPTKPAPDKAVVKFDYTRPPASGVAGLQEMARPLLPQIAAAMPGFLAKNAERMIRALLTECQKTPALLDCTPKSLFGAVIQVAQLGLELGGPAGQAYLLPFGKKSAGVAEATLVIGYKGFVQLAYRAGVENFTPRTVFEGDVFSIEYGTRHEIRHVPQFKSDKPLGYYAIVKTPTGGVDFEYLTHEQAEAHRARYALAKSGGAWATNFEEMAKKTAIRKLAKRVPLSVEWVAAAALDEMADEGVPQQLSAAVVLAGELEPDKPGLRERLAGAKAPAAKEEPKAKDERGPDATPELDPDGNPIFTAGAPAGQLFGNDTGEQPKH